MVFRQTGDLPYFLGYKCAFRIQRGTIHQILSWVAKICIILWIEKLNFLTECLILRANLAVTKITSGDCRPPSTSPKNPHSRGSSK